MHEDEGRRVAEEELAPGERLVWHGSPKPLRLRAAGLLMAVVTAGFLVAAVGAFRNVARTSTIPEGFETPGDGAQPLLLLLPFGMVFVTVVALILATPFWAARRLTHTVYVITDRRAVIIVGTLGRSVRSFTASMMGSLERRERRDGSGDLIFARRLSEEGFDTEADLGLDGGPRPNGRRMGVEEVGFIGVPNVREVERLLRENLLKAS